MGRLFLDQQWEVRNGKLCLTLLSSVSIAGKTLQLYLIPWCVCVTSRNTLGTDGLWITEMLAVSRAARDKATEMLD